MSFPLYTVRKRRAEGRKGGMREKESNQQRSGRLLVATALVVETGRWAQARGRPRAVPAVSGQAGPLTGAVVGGEFSLSRRRSTLFSRRVLSTAVSSKAENS